MRSVEHIVEVVSGVTLSFSQYPPGLFIDNAWTIQKLFLVVHRGESDSNYESDRTEKLFCILFIYSGGAQSEQLFGSHNYL